MNLTVKTGTLCLLILSLSCTDKRKEQSKITEIESVSDSFKSTKTMVSENKTSAIYFKASGTEPFWSLELSEEHIKLKTITDSIVAPYKEPLQAMDNNVTTYKIQTESSQLNIHITQSECTNAMSGKVLPYLVTVEYKKNREPSLHKIQGCGNYITDN